MKARAPWTLAFLGVLCLAACDDVTVVTGADPHASEALTRAGIAHRVTDEGVRVRTDDVANAVTALRATPTPQPGFEAVYATGALVPDPTEAHVRADQAVAGELARSIGAMHGVQTARVHVSRPAARDLALDDPSGQPRAAASVWVLHTEPVDLGAIRQLVAGSLPGVHAEDVTVLEAAASPVVSAPAPPHGFDLRRALVLSLAFNALLAMGLIASRLRATTALFPARRKDTHG